MHNHVTETRGVIPLFSQILRATLLALVAATSLADEAALDPVRDFMLLANAEEHVIGQNMVLEKIGKEHPDLLPEVERAMTDLQSDRLRPGLENIPKLLARGLPRASAAAKERMAKRAENIALAKRLVTAVQMNREKALERLLDISRRGKGDFRQTEVADAILSADPRYRNNPMAEINAGYWKGITSLGHAKGKGRNVALWVPRTWDVSEGDGPNVVKRAVSNQGTGPVSLVFIIMNQPIGENGSPNFMTAADHELLLHNVGQIPPPSGTTAVTSSKEYIGGRWWARQVVECPAESGFRRYEAFSLYHNRHVISIGFNLAGNDKAETDALATHYGKAMREMVGLARVEDEAHYPQYADAALPAIDADLGMRWGLAAAMYFMLAPLVSTFWSMLAPFAGVIKNPSAIYVMVQFALIGSYPLALWSYFAKSGIGRWRSLVPVLSALELCKLAGLRRRWLFLLLLPYAGSWIVHGMLSRRLSRRHGLGWPMTLSLIFLPCLGLTLLARHKPLGQISAQSANLPEAGPKSLSKPKE